MSDAGETLIRVNARDDVLGPASRGSCHAGSGILHRAFSVYLFDEEGRLLIQRRSEHKTLWPLYWSNSCCSHPRWGEEGAAAAERRVEEELGVHAELRCRFKFSYQARFGDVGSENELCSVYTGMLREPLQPDTKEVAEWRFAAPSELDRILRDESTPYTPWLRLGWQRLRSGASAEEPSP